MTMQTDILAQAARKGKPSIRDRAAVRVCPNCGAPSPARTSPRGPAPLYCKDRNCKRELSNRNLTDGAALVPYLKAWRIDRGTGEIARASFDRICRIVDRLCEADREAGRPRGDYHAAILLDSNMPTVDELRYGWAKIEQAREARGEEIAPRPAPKADPLAAIRAKLDDAATGDNERAVLAAALEIMQASA